MTDKRANSDRRSDSVSNDRRDGIDRRSDERRSDQDRRS